MTSELVTGGVYENGLILMANFKLQYTVIELYVSQIAIKLLANKRIYLSGNTYEPSTK